jgi:X-linked retinitis pigmentosa GTPase regulator
MSHSNTQQNIPKKSVEPSFQQNTSHNLCEGYLFKSPRGFFGGKWRKRFFCLNNNSETITYFDGLKEKGKIKINHQTHAVMDDAKTCPEEPAFFVFRLDSRNEKIYLAAKTDTERHVWVSHINNLSKHLKDLQYSKNKNIGKNRSSVAAVTGVVQDGGGYIPRPRILTKETFFSAEENIDFAPPPLIDALPPPPRDSNYPQPKGRVHTRESDANYTASEAANKVDNNNFLPPPPSIRNNSFGQAPPPSPSSTGKANNTRRTWKENERGEYSGFYVWGANDSGQLGFNESEVHTAIKPKKIKMMIGNQRSVEIASAGTGHTFCLTKNNKMYLTGSGRKGQLGCGKMKVVQRFSITRTLKNVRVMHIACGAHHTVCQTSDGNVLSWGTGLTGCLGLGPDITYTDVPLQVKEVGAENHVLINRFTCGEDKTIFITHAGIVKACGLNGKFSTLGLENTLENIYIPTPVLSFGNNDSRIIDAGLGTNFAAYLNDDGNVYVCGQINMETHLKKGDDTDNGGEKKNDRASVKHIPLEPYLTPKLFKIKHGSIKAIAAGSEHLLALVKNTVTGQGPMLYSMGNGQNGRLGHGNVDDVNDRFEQVESLRDIPGKQISCGNSFSAMLSKGGSLFTFGDGHSGQLGSGALLDINIPLRIHEPEEEDGKACHYSFISCGTEHMVSIVSRGKATGAAAHYADITHLKDNTIKDTMKIVTDKMSDLMKQKEVYYKDFDGKIYGPMSGEVIRYWYDHKAISSKLLVSFNDKNHEGNSPKLSWIKIKDYFDLNN